MQPTITILEKINYNSNKNKNEVFTRLYRYLLRTDLYYVAYKKLYKNSGAATKGVNDDTADGFSESKVNKIIQSLADGTYSPKPARRTYIQKANGKMRPLGIPTFTDKLVQEVLRMILQAVYEPIFSVYSHGFRPNKSCHTTLKDLKNRFNGTKWFIEGDIKGCFDNINHKKLVEIISAKIKDAKLIQLIWKILKAGYLEDWKYNKTHSGTPQGGIISPILANIYLNELDKKVVEMSVEFNKPSERKIAADYLKERYQLTLLKREIDLTDNAEKKQELLKKWRTVRAKMMTLPFKCETDKQIKYIRYADDFLIGVNSDKAECELIKSKLKTFICETLKMELSEEKTLITHSNEYARFLGYDIKVRRSSQLKPSNKSCNSHTKRTLHNMVELSIPFKDKIERFLFNNKAVKVRNGELFPIHRSRLIGLTDHEIVTAYNAEFRGICNYYNLASNYAKLHFFEYLMEYSCLKTLAGKYRSSIDKIKTKYRSHDGWCIPYETKSGKKNLYFARLADCKNNTNVSDTITKTPTMLKTSNTNFEERLKARVCELCKCDDSEHYEIHHVNKVKNLKGKEPWERSMIAKRRKTMVVCHECHKRIHGKKNKEL